MLFKSKNATEAMPEATPTAGHPSSASAADASAEELALRKQRAVASRRLAQTVGDIVNLMMRAEAYQDLTIRELKQLLIPPVLAGQCLVVRHRRKSDGLVIPVGVVLWASVSDAVDVRLSTNVNNPSRLAPEEWSSGKHLWVVDAIGDPKVINIMLSRLRSSTWSGRAVKTRLKQASGNFTVHVLQEAS